MKNRVPSEPILCYLSELRRHFRRKVLNFKSLFTALRVAVNHELTVCGWLPPFYSSGVRRFTKKGLSKYYKHFQGVVNREPRDGGWEARFRRQVTGAVSLAYRKCLECSGMSTCIPYELASIAGVWGRAVQHEAPSPIAKSARKGCDAMII
jgi:hypothetical protein